MIIAGAGGHAQEIATELFWSGYKGPLFFFDNTPGAALTLFNLPVLHNESETLKALAIDNRFIIGVGKPSVRSLMYTKFTEWGGVAYSLLSAHALIGEYNITLEEGLNVMAGAVITASVQVGRGTLVNSRANIHHECVIGSFCELSPGCKILGKVNIGNNTTVGSNAVVLGGLTIGSNVIIGAGSVVTKNVPDGVTVKGVPGRW